MKRSTSLAVATILASTGTLAATSTASDAAASHRAVRTVAKALNGSRVSLRLLTAIDRLKVATPASSGYARSKFRSWDDANHNCRDTRAEVLRAESNRKVTGTCTVRTGRWHAYYDIGTFTKASQLDIDHLVPLAEVWRSGARSWTANRREAYANDLSDGRTLVAVSAHVNRSKGDRDPGQWLPLNGRCRYVASWVAVKTRWGLSIDRTEKAALIEQVHGCGNSMMTVRHARVVSVGATKHHTVKHTAKPKPGPQPKPSGTDPRFRTCTDAIAHGYGPYYRGRDPEYPWYEDRDHDGIVCE